MDEYERTLDFTGLSYDSMRVAVTGAAGFIGSPLVDRLVSDGHDVTVLVRRERVEQRLRGGVSP
jgi:nucleoside-diphosphate-sugar epimerase